MSSRDIANLKNGLVAAWIPSLGSTGYRLVDRVGSNHGRILNGSSAIWDVVSNVSALKLSGTNVTQNNESGYSQVYSSFNKDFGESKSITSSFWFYPTSTNRRSILGSGPNWTNPRFGVAYSTGGTGKIECYRGSVSGSKYSDGTISTNTWSHVVVTNDGTTTKFFLNGKLDSSFAQIDSASTQTTFGVGAGYWGTIDGYLNDVRIYQRVLTDTEIKILSSEQGIGFKTNSRTSSVFAKRYSYKPPKDKTYAAITRSQSDYDSLREGLVLAICPSVSGATGYRAVDVSGRGNHGTLTNMTPEDWVSSNGLALDFDGSNDYVLTANSLLSGSTATTTVFSMSSWFYITSLPSGRRQICPARTSGTGLFAALLELGSGKITIRADNGGVAVYAFADTEDAPTNQWVHVCGTWNGATKVATLYKNGIQLGTVDYSASTANPATAQEWLIAALRYDASLIHYFPGQIDDSRVYGRLLTPSEIRLLASKRGIGLRSQKQTMFYQFPSGSKRRRLLTGMT
jgi:hypothetical protein